MKLAKWDSFREMKNMLDRYNRAIRLPETVILDVRPVDYFTGKKQDEARGGGTSQVPSTVPCPRI